MCRAERGALGWQKLSLPVGAGASSRSLSAGRVFSACRHWNERLLETPFTEALYANNYLFYTLTRIFRAIILTRIQKVNMWN